MSVIVEFRVPSGDFERGQILHVEAGTSIELETLVPVGDATVPLFWVHNTSREQFIESVRRHPSVNEAMEVDVFADRALFTLDWDVNQDHLFRAIRASEGQLLGANGTADAWEFELRFPSHENLSEFTDRCEDAQISMEVSRVYNPTAPSGGPRYGLSDPQFEALCLAVEMGYYDIPRGCTTKELAAELGISDQAVTERLRRAIATLTRHTIVQSAEWP